jgi:hypothetical protein
MNIKTINHQVIQVPISTIQRGNAVPQYEVNLFYVRIHTAGDTTRDELSYLQVRRTCEANNWPAPVPLKQRYIQELDGNANQIARLFLNHSQVISDPVALVVEPPTNAKDHKAYADAIARQIGSPSIQPFKKAMSASAANSEIGFEELNNAVTLDETLLPGDLARHRHVVIVDDVFSEGNTAAVAAHKLKPFLRKDVRMSVFCVLRIAP